MRAFFQAVALVLLLLFSFAATTKLMGASAEINNGCLQKCGNITIPYPFGATDECHLSGQPTFFITCNTTFHPPKPFLNRGNLEVTNISLDNGEIHVLTLAASNCCSLDGNDTRCIGSTESTLETGNFTISPAKNKFMAMGCSTVATFRSRLKQSKWLHTDCSSYCLSEAEIDQEDSCSGIGCCQATIPQRLSFSMVRVRSHYNQDASNFSNCSFAFVAQNDFKFKKKYLRELSTQKVPVVLDWAIGGQTCDVAALNHSTFLCKANTRCYNKSEGNPGYLCKCQDGYQGNPYLEHPDHGCKDIDECSDPGLNNCKSICINSPGNYTCRCPEGYHGDGRRNGSGCFRRFYLVIAIAAGSFAALCLLFLFLGTWWFAKVLRRRKDAKQRQDFFKRNGGLLLQQKLVSKEGGFEKTKIFVVAELEVATDKFNENRIVGHGGQGTVYKGMLEDGRNVAVKKSKHVNTEQLEQFVNEFVILSQIDHRNVVKLLGCCLETEIPLLVYEFIPGGTLFQLIHDKTEESPLTWEMRLRVAAEVSSSIAYLHAYASAPVFHRDIKTSNILLDEKLRAKLSDFGISKSLDIDQTHFTTEVKGTFGYFDPEYFRSNHFTEKSDVYSFGVVLAELVTGMKPISTFGPLAEPMGLVGHFISSMEEDRLFEILDERVAVEAADWQVMAVAELVKRCLDYEGKNRPSMKDIARELDGIRSQVKKTHKSMKLGPREFDGIRSGMKKTHKSMTLGLDPSPTMFYYDSSKASSNSLETKPFMFHSW